MYWKASYQDQQDSTQKAKKAKRFYKQKAGHFSKS